MSQGKLNFYEEVASNNEGVTAKNIKSMFVWYDLFAFTLSFQLLFIAAYSLGYDFAVTMISVIFIMITDTLLKTFLAKDNKNYTKFKEEMALVKLWTIPLCVLVTATMVSLIIVTFGLI